MIDITEDKLVTILEDIIFYLELGMDSMRVKHNILLGHKINIHLDLLYTIKRPSMELTITLLCKELIRKYDLGINIDIDFFTKSKKILVLKTILRDIKINNLLVE